MSFYFELHEEFRLASYNGSSNVATSSYKQASNNNYNKKHGVWLSSCLLLLDKPLSFLRKREENERRLKILNYYNTKRK